MRVGWGIVAESWRLRVHSGLFDERVPHKPGECQTDGRDRQVVLERPYRKIHIFDFAALL